MLAGVVVIAGGGVLASAIVQQAPTSAEAEANAVAERCETIVDAVDRPSSIAEADAAIAEAAAAAGFDVDREETQREDTVPKPSGEAVIVVEQTRWTVLDGDAEVVAFTWTSSQGGTVERFSTDGCA